VHVIEGVHDRGDDRRDCAVLAEEGGVRERGVGDDSDNVEGDRCAHGVDVHLDALERDCRLQRARGGKRRLRRWHGEADLVRLSKFGSLVRFGILVRFGKMVRLVTYFDRSLVRFGILVRFGKMVRLVIYFDLGFGELRDRGIGGGSGHYRRRWSVIFGGFSGEFEFGSRKPIFSFFSRILACPCRSWGQGRSLRRVVAVSGRISGSGFLASIQRGGRMGRGRLERCIGGLGVCWDVAEEAARGKSGVCVVCGVCRRECRSLRFGGEECRQEGKPGPGGRRVGTVHCGILALVLHEVCALRARGNGGAQCRASRAVSVEYVGRRQSGNTRSGAQRLVADG